MDSPRLLWTPSQQTIQNSNLTKYIQWLEEKKNLKLSDYHSLWKWSVEHLEDFWKTIWEYFDIQHDGKIDRVTSVDPMPRVKWFEGTRLNYAEHIFRKRNDANPAIIFKSESAVVRTITWGELEQQVASLQAFFRSKGIQKDDRVVGYLPCIPEASAGLLATNSMLGMAFTKSRTTSVLSKVFPA